MTDAPQPERPRGKPRERYREYEHAPPVLDLDDYAEHLLATRASAPPPDDTFVHRLRIFTYVVTSTASILFILLVVYGVVQLNAVAAQWREAFPAAAPPPTTAPPLPPPTTAPPPATGTDVVRYEVEGAGAGSISYVADEAFSQQQLIDEPLPWSAEITLPTDVFTPVSLTAQSSSEQDGELLCRILRNGAVVTESTGSGPFAVVTCVE